MLWGLLGSGVAEALTLSASMRPTGRQRRWRWPWGKQSDLPVIATAVILRLFIGSGVTAPLGASGQLPTPFTAFLAGIAAPLIVARIFATFPTSPANDAPALGVLSSPASPLDRGAEEKAITVAAVAPDPSDLDVRSGRVSDATS